MKRAVLNHPKLFALMAEADITRPTAIGILVLLWDFTGQYAPTGAVGRFTDQVIADAVGWEGEASDLVAHLVRTGWVDESGVRSVRLIVHDWERGCERWVKRRLETAGESFCKDGVRSVHPIRTPETDGGSVDPIGTASPSLPIHPEEQEKYKDKTKSESKIGSSGWMEGKSASDMLSAVGVNGTTLKVLSDDSRVTSKVVRINCQGLDAVEIRDQAAVIVSRLASLFDIKLAKGEGLSASANKLVKILEQNRRKA